MYDKPTMVGQTVAIGSSTPITTGTINANTTGTIYSSGNLGMGCLNPTSLLTLTNPNNMNQQVKIAVFKVTRNKHNEIKSSEFITEMWIENKPGVSIDFAVAKKLDNKYEANEIVIKQIFTVSL
jgi:hypothetical protein